MLVKRCRHCKEYRRRPCIRDDLLRASSCWEKTLNSMLVKCWRHCKHYRRRPCKKQPSPCRRKEGKSLLRDCAYLGAFCAAPLVNSLLPPRAGGHQCLSLRHRSEHSYFVS